LDSSMPNWSVLNRGESSNFIASAPNDVANSCVLRRRRPRTSIQMCHPAAPIEMKRRLQTPVSRAMLRPMITRLTAYAGPVLLDARVAGNTILDQTQLLKARQWKWGGGVSSPTALHPTPRHRSRSSVLIRRIARIRENQRQSVRSMRPPGTDTYRPDCLVGPVAREVAPVGSRTRESKRGNFSARESCLLRQETKVSTRATRVVGSSPRRRPTRPDEPAFSARRR
jgi:hypothetical protein